MKTTHYVAREPDAQGIFITPTPSTRCGRRWSSVS